MTIARDAEIESRGESRASDRSESDASSFLLDDRAMCGAGHSATRYVDLRIDRLSVSPLEELRLQTEELDSRRRWV
jgi:hypothetical protein